MKERHRRRELSAKKKDGSLVAKIRKRITRELTDGKDVESNRKYLGELNKWKP